MLESVRPKIKFLSDEMVDKIIDEAIDVLKNVGVFVENNDAVSLLGNAGARIDSKKNKVFVNESLVEDSLESAQKRITLYDAHGDIAMDLCGDNIHFDPGSAAINILDSETGEIRKAETGDFVKLAALVENLDNYAAQSTAFVCYDVPEEIADRYRLYLALLNCRKPVVTGTFRTDGFEVMKDMLVAVRGSEKALREKPLAIFDACPSPPLKWSNLTTQTLIDCAKYGIPSEMVSMPLSGATAPVTLVGSLVQHTAECMIGVVISQLASKGAPIIWGGSPSIFDMKKGTTPMGAIETMMIDSSYSQIGKYLGLPIHAYMGLSDSKAIDAQAGLETGMSAMMAALAGVNVISGAGMMDFESLQSLEKLVIDHEIAGMTLRLVRGVECKFDVPTIDLFREFETAGSFLSMAHTLKHFRNEFFIPGPTIDRSASSEWLETGRKTSFDRAKEQVKKILKKGKRYSPPEDMKKKLHKIMSENAKMFGMDKLPETG
ncbi:MAG: trimethylamine methyltransferase family protein [Candidatus Eremiobacteraeota bacterium]|nr:trimethylamine methyltransferase family protein [Candidatus Eremiobacteraeota bacterium]